MARKGTPSIETTVKAKNDAYTGMLSISLIALVVGCVLLFLDYSQYHPDKKPPAIQKVLPTAGGEAPAAPAPGAPAPAPAPAGGNPAPAPGGAQ